MRQSQIVYVSVGAMGPDDPSITKDITLTANGTNVTYQLIVKPCTCIIEDVILKDNSGQYWLIQDRNVQDVNAYKDYIGLNSIGTKSQAYNFSYIYPNSFSIPNKYLGYNSGFQENKHLLYQGKFTTFRGSSDTADQEEARESWLKLYGEKVDPLNISPFYKVEEGNGNYEQWVFPTLDIINLCSSNLKVSKMRLFLLSEVKVKDKNEEIPVCCYWPYYANAIGDTSSYTYAYYTSSNGTKPDGVSIIIFNYTAISTHKVDINKVKYQPGLVRLVRPLTTDELEMYKKNYLGYGSEPHKLTICHPDTYESTSQGWLQY